MLQFDIVILLRTKQVMTSKTKIKSVRQLYVSQLYVLLVDSTERGLFIHSFIIMPKQYNTKYSNQCRDNARTIVHLHLVHLATSLSGSGRAIKSYEVLQRQPWRHGNVRGKYEVLRGLI